MEPNPPDDKAKPTVAGCILTLLTLAVIFSVAIPVVRWRDPNGEPLPRNLAIILPILAGAVFFAIISGLLRLVGLRIWVGPGPDESPPPEG
jgi:hypothetical protein